MYTLSTQPIVFLLAHKKCSWIMQINLFLPLCTSAVISFHQKVFSCYSRKTISRNKFPVAQVPRGQIVFFCPRSGLHHFRSVIALFNFRAKFYSLNFWEVVKTFDTGINWRVNQAELLINCLSTSIQRLSNNTLSSWIKKAATESFRYHRNCELFLGTNIILALQDVFPFIAHQVEWSPN